MMVPWCHVGRVCDVLQQQTRASVSPAVMGMGWSGNRVAVLEPWLSVGVGGRAVDGVCVWPKKVNSSLRNLAIGCHEADRPRLITAASHQHEDDPGRSRASSLLF